MSRYLAILLLVASSCAMGETMTHEETIVRTAYAKFAYAVEQGLVGHMALEAENPIMAKHDPDATKPAAQRLAEGQVHFTLSDFSVGNLQDILDSKVSDFMSSPTTEVLAVSNGVQKYDESGRDTKWNYFDARWNSQEPLSSEAMNLSLKELYQLQTDKGQRRRGDTWLRYAAYKVVARHQGKSRGPYKAMFLFGHDASGNEVVEPDDAMTDVTGLAYALHEHWFPDSFTLTKLRQQPVVIDWLGEKQRNGPSCSVGQHDVCCDLTTLTCGPSRADVDVGLSQPLAGTGVKR
jgi:hypothetical protein